MAADTKRGASRLSRRAALQAGATAGAVGGSVAAGVIRPGLGPAPVGAQPTLWRTVHLEVDYVTGTAINIVRAGSGPSQRGDWFYNDASIYEVGQSTDGPEIGVYQCFGAWTRAATETSAVEQRLTSVQFRLFGRGTISGLINEAGTDPDGHVGAVQGGTEEFLGALGSFRQTRPADPASPLRRGMFDLMLPNLS